MSGLDAGAVAARRLASVIATSVFGAMLIAGILVGALPVHRAGVSCGSAFHASDEAVGADFLDAIRADNGFGLSAPLGSVSDACDDARSGRLAPSVVLISVGGLGTLIGAVLWSRYSPGARERIARERAHVEELRRRGVIK